MISGAFSLAAAFTEDLQQHPDGPSHLEAVGAPSDMSLPEPVVTPSQQPQLMSPDSMQTQPADSSMLPIPPELIPVPSNQLAMEGIPPSEATPLQQSLLPLEGVSPNQTSPLPPNLLPLEGGSSNTIPQLQSHLLASLGGISPSNAPPFVPPTNAMPTLQSNLLSLHNNGITQAHSSQTQLPPATAAEIMSQLGIQLSEDGAQQLLSPSQLHLQQTAAGNGMAAASSYSMASSGPYAAVSSAEAYGSVSSGSYYASSEGYTAPSGDGYTAPSGDGYTVPSSNGYTAGNSGSFTASSSDGYTAASSGSFTGPSSYGSTAPSSDGYTAPSSDGYTAASSDGYTAASSDGYTAASNDGYVAPSSDGYVAPSSDGYTVASSGSFTASSNTGYVAPSSGGYNADGSVVASTGTPFMAGSMAGSMTGSADAYATAIPLDPSTANFNQGGVSLPPVTFPVDMATQQLQTQATNTAVNMLPSVPQQSNVPVDMNQIYNYDNLGMTQTSPFMATPPNVGGFSAAGSGMQESMQSTVQLSSQPQVQLQPLMSSSQAEQPRTIIVREEIEVVREPPAKRSKNETVSVGIQCEVGQETVAALREEERVAHAQGVYPSAELEIEASAIQIPDGGGGGGGEKSVVMMAREAYTEGGAQYQATNGAGSQDVSSGDVIISPSHHHHHHHPAFPQEEKVVQKYPCEMDTCSKAYIHRKDLIRHMKVRHGISPQKLEPVAVENPEKPYTCPISGCGRSYCHLKDLRRHQRQCHTVNSTTADEGACESVDGEGKTMLRFPCDFPGCMRSYVHKKDLVRHKRLYHNDASSKPSVPIPVRYTEAELKRIKQEEKSERAAESDEKLDKLEKQRLTSTGSTVSTSGAEDPPNSATIMETERNHVLPDSADLASLTASGIMENLSINVVVRGDLASQAESAANALLATPEGTTVSSRSNSSAMSDLASSNSNHPPANSSSHEMISDGSVLSQDSLSQHRFIQQSLEKPQLPNATRTDDLAATTNPSMPISEISGSGGGVYPGSRSISYNMGALEEAFAHASEGGVIYGFSQQPKTTTSSLQPQQQPQQQQEQLQDGSSTQYDPTTVLNHPLSTTNTNTLQSSAASLQSVVSELQLLTSTQGVSPLSQGTF